MNRAIKLYDFSVLCGFRNEADQDFAYDNGFSKLKWPNSKHNSKPSRAVDIAPYPINWNDSVRFTELAIVVKGIASELFIPIAWGGDWRFFDLPHFELLPESLRDHAEGAS